MSHQPPEAAGPPQTPVDLGNALLGASPAQLATSRTIVQQPVFRDGELVIGDDGQPTLEDVALVVLTIRTPSTTLTVFLREDHAAGWADSIAQTAGIKARAAAAGLIVPNGLPHLEPGIAEAIRRAGGRP